MGTMSRQRDADIQDGLTASAGDVDAELDHIVAQHNESETRLVAAEADIDTNTANIASINAAFPLTQERYTTDGDYTYTTNDDGQFLVDTAAQRTITLPDPEGTYSREAGDKFEIVCDCNVGTLVDSNYWIGGGQREIELRLHDILRVTVVDDGTNLRFHGVVERDASHTSADVYEMQGAGGNYTVTNTDWPRMIIGDGDGNTQTVTLPEIDQTNHGRRITIWNTGVGVSDVISITVQGTDVFMDRQGSKASPVAVLYANWIEIEARYDCPYEGTTGGVWLCVAGERNA